MPAQTDEHLVNECKQIEDDCEYTAEAHYYLENTAKWVSILFKTIPALAAAIGGIAIINGLSNWYAWLSILAAAAFAMQSIFNPDKTRDEHLFAAKNYTALKHEARALYKTFRHEMDHDSFYIQIRILRERYSNIAQFTPPTTNKAFEEARKKIKAGRHTPDFIEDQNNSN